MRARYVHTNLIARDWKRLAGFYERVFGCVKLEPERDLGGEWLERATAVRGARLRGAHLRLPGHGDGGPTLEIFEYDPPFDADDLRVALNRPGLAHLAFVVDDVAAARDEVIAAGGYAVGDRVTTRVEGQGEVDFVYVADPEGNVIELQRWTAE